MKALPKGFLLDNTYLIEDLMAQSSTEIFYIATDVKEKASVVVRELYVHKICTRTLVGKVLPLANYEAHFETLCEAYGNNAVFFSRFQHPNIASIRRVFKNNGSIYLIAKFIRGESLSELLKSKGKMEEAELLPLIGQIADALHDLHLSGKLYLDIRPENVLITQKGKAILLAPDFVRQRTQTRFDQSNYTAIEMHIARYTDKRLKPSADVYGLAALLYHCLLGQPPISSIERQNAGLPQYLLPESLRETIMKAMAMPAEDRFQNIHAFIIALHGKLPAKDADLVALPKGSPLHEGKYRVERLIHLGEAGILYELRKNGKSEVLWAFELFFANACMRGAKGKVTPYDIPTSSWALAKKSLRNLFDAPKMGASVCKLLRVKRCFEENNTLYLLADADKMTNVKHFVRENGCLSVHDALRYTKQVAKCIIGWRKAGLNKVNVSLKNMMIDSSGSARLWLPAFCQTAVYSHLPDGVAANLAGHVSHSTKNIDEKHDVHRLSALLYYCLTGSEVVVETATRLPEKLIPPAIINPEVPPGLNDLLLQCLSNDTQHVAPRTIKNFLEGIEQGKVDELKGRLRGLMSKLAHKF